MKKILSFLTTLILVLMMVTVMTACDKPDNSDNTEMTNAEVAAIVNTIAKDFDAVHTAQASSVKLASANVITAYAAEVPVTYTSVFEEYMTDTKANATENQDNSMAQLVFGISDTTAKLTDFKQNTIYKGEIDMFQGMTGSGLDKCYSRISSSANVVTIDFAVESRSGTMTQYMQAKIYFTDKDNYVINIQGLVTGTALESNNCYVIMSVKQAGGQRTEIVSASVMISAKSPNAGQIEAATITVGGELADLWGYTGNKGIKTIDGVQIDKVKYAKKIILDCGANSHAYESFTPRMPNATEASEYTAWYTEFRSSDTAELQNVT